MVFHIVFILSSGVGWCGSASLMDCMGCCLCSQRLRLMIRSVHASIIRFSDLVGLLVVASRYQTQSIAHGPIILVSFSVQMSLWFRFSLPSTVIYLTLLLISVIMFCFCAFDSLFFLVFFFRVMFV